MPPPTPAPELQPLEVIGTGFGRTGTLSLKHALEQLGLGPCYHMQELMRRPSHINTWHDLAMGAPVDLHELLAGFHSTVDFPTSVIWRDLLEAFPDAKVIHTVRDAGRWWHSTDETIHLARSMLPAWFQRTVPLARRWLEMNDALVWDGLFEGRFADRDRAIATYRRQEAEVRAAVPPEQLLVFDVAEGWEPLCDFLGVAVPDGPFPRVNDRDQMRRRILATRWGLRVVPVLAAGTAVLVAARRRRRG